MCPFCLASLGLIVAGATSAGGLAALAVRVSRQNRHTPESISDSSERSTPDVIPYSR